MMPNEKKNRLGRGPKGLKAQRVARKAAKAAKAAQDSTTQDSTTQDPTTQDPVATPKTSLRAGRRGKGAGLKAQRAGRRGKGVGLKAKRAARKAAKAAKATQDQAVQDTTTQDASADPKASPRAGRKGLRAQKAGTPARKSVAARIKKHDLAITTITKKLMMLRRRISRLGKTTHKVITFKLIPISGMPVGAFVDVIYNPNKGSNVTLHLNVTNFERTVTVDTETTATWKAACSDSTYEPVVDSGNLKTTTSQTVVIQMAKTVQMVQFDAKFPDSAQSDVKVNVDYNPNHGTDAKFSLSAKTGGEYYAIQLGGEDQADYTVTLPDTVAHNANFVLATTEGANQTLHDDGSLTGHIGSFPKAVTNVPININQVGGC